MKLEKIEAEKIKEILQQAHSLLSDRKRWCQGHLYTNTIEGKKFCAVGAARVQASVVPNGFYFLSKTIDFLDFISDELYLTNAIFVNDQQDQDKAYQEVLSIYLESINRLNQILKES